MNSKFAGYAGHSIDLSNLTVVGLYTRNGFVTTVIKEIYKSSKKYINLRKVNISYVGP